MSYEVDETFGCHLWTGKLDSNGYAYHGKSRAHIVVWERENGPRPIEPNGQLYEIEHWCKRRSCCNPLHLEAVTARENQLRKSWAYRSRIKTCPRGHSLNNAMVTPEMGRCCRQCITV